MAASRVDEQAAEREDVDEIELALLLEGVYRRYGFDFREYAGASLRRRVWRRVHAEGLQTLSALQDELERPFTEEELEAMNRAWEARREERRDRKRRRREGRGGGSNGEVEDRSARHRRRQRPGRRERAQRRETPDAGRTPNDNEHRRGPRPYVEGERNEQSRRRGGLRGRRGPRWR